MTEMAQGVATEIISMEPSNMRARTYLQSPQGISAARSATTPARQPAAARPARLRIQPASQPQTEQERASVEQAFREGYLGLSCQAELLELELKALQRVGQVDDGRVFEDLRGLLEGRMTTVVSKSPPRPVRQLLRELNGDRQRCEELIIEDFDEVMRWVLAENPSADADELRNRLMQRQMILEAALPPELEDMARVAMSHIERELINVGRRYANTETMMMDPISEIPRANFLVTEDNFAWDMEELANALEANNGVMRNPISKQMFSPDDVRKILGHQLGQRLRPLSLEQSQLKHGVRAATIDRLASLAEIMLEDQSATAGPSLHALDEFLVYSAALPAEEQKTLELLKVPATDGHTGQAYDYTISDSVRDAKANRTCFHKTGDFLSQAATYLRDS
jgi:hypothetical protein